MRVFWVGLEAQTLGTVHVSSFLLIQVDSSREKR